MRVAGVDQLEASLGGLLDRIEAAEGEPARSVVGESRKQLGQPFLVALTGRVNTGKSTLVNALVGQRIAPTDARESTAVLTLYRFGAPLAASVELDGGRRLPLRLERGEPQLPPEHVDTARLLTVDVQSASLARVSLLDTPGLGSATTANSARTQGALLSGSGPLPAPSVLLYLSRGPLRADDRAFLADWRAHSQGTALVVGVFSHADAFGAGAWSEADPIERAVAHAEAAADREELLDAAVAVSGLLAETARTGVLRESDLRSLRLLSDAQDQDLQLAPQLGPPPGLSAESLARLTSLLGPYGLRYGRRAAGTSGSLLDWLEVRSGLARLEGLVADWIGGPASLARIDSIVASLRGASRSWDRGAYLLEAALHAPELLPIQEWRAASLLTSAVPREHLLPALDEVIARPLGAEWPGGPEAAAELAAKYQAMASAATTGAEAEAARVLSRSCLVRGLQRGDRP